MKSEPCKQSQKNGEYVSRVQLFTQPGVARAGETCWGEGWGSSVDPQLIRTIGFHNVLEKTVLHSSQSKWPGIRRSVRAAKH